MTPASSRPPGERVFTLTHPPGSSTPVLVEVPHAGLHVPPDVQGSLLASADALRRDADLLVDLLYERAPEVGATLLVAHNSRYVVDLNRAPDDVDAETVVDHPSPRAAQPRGVVWRATTDGRPALARPLRKVDLEARLSRYYRPYHDALEREVSRLRGKHGWCILVAAHSMPSQGRSGHTDAGAARADVVPGTRGRTSADPRVIDFVDAHFRRAGLSVRHDDPYRGGYTTGHYGRPRDGVHAVQIELNRALYMDESTGTPKPASFGATATLVTALVRALGALDLR